MKSILLSMLILAAFACSNNKDQKQKESTIPERGVVQSENTVDEADVAEVYYFHGNRRCETCKAVGIISNGFTKMTYKNELENGKVKYHEINYDQEGNEKLVEKFQVSGSSLFVRTVKDNHEEIVNLTELAFLYAALDADKIREAIKSEIEIVLN